MRASHPTWLSLQLPSEVADLLGYAPTSKEGGRASQSISFLGRGPGIVRVVATYPAREALAVETVRSRLIATARPGEHLLFSLPAAVGLHLGLQTFVKEPRSRGTDDSVLWFVPAPEYYEYRSIVGSGKPWVRPSSGPLAHVYLAKSLIPLPKEFPRLAETEFRIEEEEWRPGVTALQRVGRGRRVIL